MGKKWYKYQPPRGLGEVENSLFCGALTWQLPPGLQILKGKQGQGRETRKPLSVYGDTGKSSLTAQASHRGHLDLAHFSELNKIIVQLKAKLWGKFILSSCGVKKYWKCKKFQLISRIHLLFIHLFFQTASKY